MELREKLILEINELTRDHGYVTLASHGAIEIKPPVVWSKGNAALLILDEFYGKGWEQKNVHVIFMGDDTSDEDAMRVRSFSNYFANTINLEFREIFFYNHVLGISATKRKRNHVPNNCKAKLSIRCHVQDPICDHSNIHFGMACPKHRCKLIPKY